MIEITQTRRCLWRNPYAPMPVLAADLRLGEAAHWTAASLAEPIMTALCEKLQGVRVAAQMDAPEMIAEIAQQLQCSVDITATTCGVHSRDGENQTATIFFSCRDEFIAEVSLRMAAQLAANLIQPSLTLQQSIRLIDKVIEIAKRGALEEYDHVMIREFERRDIPWFRISGMTRHLQIGQGARQRRTLETLRSTESAVALQLTRNKLIIFEILKQLNLPVGSFAPVSDVGSALNTAETIGYPVVLKPISGKQGISVFPDLRNAQELRDAMTYAEGKGPFLLQSFFPGEDIRILIVDGKMLAAARRVPAHVTGDGKHTIHQLVERSNQNPALGDGPGKLRKIVLDRESDRVLSHHGWTRDSVPARGEFVRLLPIANTRTGGAAEDVTGMIHPDNVYTAIRAANALGLTVAGVDFIAADPAKSWREAGGGICEVNSVAGLRVHHLSNPRMDVTGPIIETIYPNRDNGRIPTAMLVGTKTTAVTARMLVKILTHAGHVVGSATADGVTIGDEKVADGDHAGIQGAAMVLRDPAVTAAVLETAPDGVAKTGIYLDWCDVAALLGSGKTKTGADAAFSRKILEAAKKAVVLDADDMQCAAMAAEFEKSIRAILISKNANAPAIRKHVKNGGEAIVPTLAAKRENIEMLSGANASSLLDIAKLPRAAAATIRENMPAALAAAGLALALGIAPLHIREGLKR